MADYRINDLAQVSGVSVRDIRVYQDRGLLPPPTIKGRTGWYHDEHLLRLNLVSRMLERGYTFATISELLNAAHHGMTVEHVLRGSTRRGRFQSFRRAATITIAELRKSLGASDRTIALTEKIGLLVKDGAGFAVKNPELLEGAEVLVKGGVDVDVLLDRWVRVQSDLEDVAHSFVSIITERFVNESLLGMDDSQVDKISELIRQVRPLAHEIVDSTFAQALDREISNALGEVIKILETDTPDGAGPNGPEQD
ncbi:MerR family transcriptional regulator [Gordonia sp. X0973]|uniref:MerR family transcriptional regulator n=1 Tax=Gordonia sp. X0973 TaxID=2742602 RepID=UPI000F52BBFA|nr:MerR family transcriptional regulator [Gordonia sp. X0973]QKT06189.1 MerR family transcriptional regulator [Gordonia sp. X0973]